MTEQRLDTLAKCYAMTRGIHSALEEAVKSYDNRLKKEPLTFGQYFVCCIRKLPDNLANNKKLADELFSKAA
ncbi:hypothetical protein FACS1894113_3020 [Alphaproteobacteria bacterium]|nr:hypothetical protein FACS1894113_3020 [Alphaproteobacteria bacterium]